MSARGTMKRPTHTSTAKTFADSEDCTAPASPPPGQIACTCVLFFCMRTRYSRSLSALSALLPNYHTHTHIHTRVTRTMVVPSEPMGTPAPRQLTGLYHYLTLLLSSTHRETDKAQRERGREREYLSNEKRCYVSSGHGIC